MNYLATAITAHQTIHSTADQALLMVFLTLTTFALAGMCSLAFVQVSNTIAQQRRTYTEDVNKILHQSSLD